MTAGAQVLRHFIGSPSLDKAAVWIVLVALLYYFTTINRVVLFWIAFVLTRPFGATFGDLLTKPSEQGGLNFGTIGSSLVLAVVLFGLLFYTIVLQPLPQAQIPQTEL